jgi:hypothetical protein
MSNPRGGYLMLRPSLIAACFAYAYAAPAFAESPTDLASEHVSAIADGDVRKIPATYSPNSTLNWAGGLLKGTYAGLVELGEVWRKFVKQAPFKAQVYSIKESANPAGKAVSIGVVFQGTSPIKVHYILLYRTRTLVEEIWQIGPNPAY